MQINISWWRSFLLGLIFIIILILTAPPVNAFTIETLSSVESRNDFVLGPGKTEIFVGPGESASRELIITNRLGRDSDFVVEVEDFAGSNDPNQPTVLLGSERGPYSLKEFLRFSPARFTLKHGERARIPVVVTIPEDAEPGGRYGAVLVSAEPPTGRSHNDTGFATGGAKIITRLGTLFFVRVNGSVNESGYLKSFRTLGRHIFSRPPIPFEILFENEGSVHLTPYGIIEITNFWGKQVGEIRIDPWFAMPESTRFREVRFAPPFLFGRYVASASINRGYEDVVDSATTVFWVIPWKVLSVGFISILFLIIFIKYLLSKFEIKRRVQF